MKKLLVIPFVLLLVNGCSINEKNNLIEKTATTVNLLTNTQQAKLNTETHLSPTFDVFEKSEGVIKGYQMRGHKGVFAFSDTAFIAGKDRSCMWYFWNEESEVVGKELKIVGTDEITGKTVDIVKKAKIEKHVGPIQSPSESDKPKLLPLGNQTNQPPTEQIRPTARSLVTIKLPDKGLWKLDIYVDGKSLGSLTVEAKDSEYDLKELS